MLILFYNYRSYSSLRYIDFVEYMAAVDPKLNETFIKMIDQHDFEMVIKKHRNLFSTNQLIEMFGEILKQPDKAANVTLAALILQRFKGEIDIKGREVTDIEKRQLEKLSNRMKTLSSINCSSTKKFTLFALFLDIIQSSQEILDMSGLLPEMVKRLQNEVTAVDADLRSVSLGLSKCLPKLNLDQELTIFASYKHHFDSVSPDQALDVFVNDAHQLNAHVSDFLFSRAKNIFDQKKDTNFLKGIWNKLTGSESRSQSQNMAKLFNRCIRDLKTQILSGAQVVRLVIDFPSVVAILKFFPNLSSGDLLPRDVIEKTRSILEESRKFFAAVESGKVTLTDLELLNDGNRLELLMSLGQMASSNPDRILMTSGLRIEERKAFFDAKDEFEKFSLHFEANQSELKKLGRQFRIDSDIMCLSSLCEVRMKKEQRITLKLQLIMPQDQLVIQRHNYLYAHSSIFRHFHHRVCIERGPVGNGLVEQNVDSDDDEYDPAVWKMVIQAAKDGLADFKVFAAELFRLQTLIAVVEDRFREIHQRQKLNAELELLRSSTPDATSRGSYRLDKVADVIDKLFEMNKFTDAAKAVNRVGFVSAHLCRV